MLESLKIPYSLSSDLLVPFVVYGSFFSVYLVVCCDYKKDLRIKKRKGEHSEVPFTLLLFNLVVYNHVSANDLVHKNEP